jgi:hypothetical protein
MDCEEAVWVEFNWMLFSIDCMRPCLTSSVSTLPTPELNAADDGLECEFGEVGRY